MPAKHTEVIGDHDKPRRRLSICKRFLRPLRFPSSKGRSSIVRSTVAGFAFYLFTLFFPSLNPFFYLNSGAAPSAESVSTSSSINADNPSIFSADPDANSKTIELPVINNDETIKSFSSYNDEKPSADDSGQPASIVDPQKIPSSAIGPMEVVAKSSSDEPEKNVAQKPDPQKIPSSAITPMAVNDRPYPIDIGKKDEEEQPEEDEHKNDEENAGNRQITNLEDLRKEEEDAMAELAKKEYEASARKKQFKTDVIQRNKSYSKIRRESFNNNEANDGAVASENQGKEEEIEEED